MDQNVHELASPPLRRGPYRVRDARFSLEERLRQVAEPPPLCQCGCGLSVGWDSGRCRWRRFAGIDHYRRPARYKDAEWLRAKYVAERLTLDEIAAECGVAQSSIIKAMKKAGIERRNRSESRIGRQVGALNPSWRGGVTPERQRLYRSAEWKQLLSACFERDGYRCVLCDAPKMRKRGLHAHHIKSWAEHPELRLEFTNLATLCDDCHHWTHSAANTERLLLS